MTVVRVIKRRAIAVRLLAFLLPVLVLGTPASAGAAAGVATPRLVGTDPVSSRNEPADVTAPAVFGEAEPGTEEEPIRDSFPFAVGSGLGPVASVAGKPTVNPTYEIRIFDAGRCAGLPVAHGTAEEFEGAGISVAVEADAETTLSATQVNPQEPSEVSACSNTLTYWEGHLTSEPASGSGDGDAGTGEPTGGETGGADGDSSTPSQSSSSSEGTSSPGSSSKASIGEAVPAGPKPTAPNLHLLPSARANDVTPRIAGSAPGAETVAVYDTPNCSGAPVAKGSPSELSTGFEVSVAKNAATTFSAVAIAAQHSGCSEPVTYSEDSTAPRTRITMGPGVKTWKHKAVFRFEDITEDPPGTTFACRVDKAKWKPCSSPFHVKHLKPRHYVVAIRATDLAGNVERRPVKRRFVVVRSPAR